MAVLLRSVIYGNTAVVHESFDAALANDAIDDGATVVSVVATMLERMPEARGVRPWPSTLRAVLLGGGPAPRALLERGVAAGVPVVHTYGLTEAASQVATLSPGDAAARAGSAGKPLFGTELRIVRDDGREALPCEAGEIVVRGPAVTPGYWRDEAATAEALRGGWLHTGDAGYVDPEGYLYVLDRRDDLIVSGGENVYPAEVENAIYGHPDVAEVAVIGVPDAKWGESVKAIVVAKPGTNPEAASIIAWARARIAAYKTPKSVAFVAALPRNAAGKLLRRELREHHSKPE
jgi:O-succinylbenzoic acid--CoA ligase